MNIIFLVRRFYPQIGGVETHVFEISKSFLKRGHKVIIITESTDNIHEMDNKNLPENFKNLQIIRINTGADNWFKKFRIWIEIFRHLSTFKKANIIHCHDVFFWFLPLRFIFPFKKVYTTFHGYETKYPPEKRAKIVRKISEILSNGNICIGDYIRKWYKTKPDYVTYGGIDKIPAASIRKFQDDKLNVQGIDLKLRIVLIGRLDGDIGVKTYLNSLELLRKDKIKFNFQAYGEGPLVKIVKKYGKVHNFTDSINSAIGSGDIVLASSYLTMLQAIAANKIVISVYENALKEDYLRMSPFSRYIYICKDSKEVFEVIKSIYKAPWKSTSMLRKGSSWAANQSWERVADTYLKLWKL